MSTRISGPKLRAFREHRGVSQGQLAAELERTRQTISQAESSMDVGTEVAERYLNGVLKLSGRRERVTVDVCISVPMGGLHADIHDDIREILS